MKKTKSNKKTRKKESFRRSLVKEIKNNKATFSVYVILRLVVIAIMVLSVLDGRFENVFVCGLSLVLFLVPAFFEKNFGIDLPSTLEIIILLFIFAAEILGEIGCYYQKVPLWDTVLHTVNGFLCAAIGFSLVDLLNRNSKSKFSLSPLYLSIVAFCFSMTIGVLWEMFEFGADTLLGTDMQKDFVINSFSSVTLDPSQSNTPILVDNIAKVEINGKDLALGGYLDIGLIDTMKDLIVNFVGAVVFSFIGFFYVKGRGRGGFAKHFIPKLDEKHNKEENNEENNEEETVD